MTNLINKIPAICFSFMPYCRRSIVEAIELKRITRLRIWISSPAIKAIHQLDGNKNDAKTKRGENLFYSTKNGVNARRFK